MATQEVRETGRHLARYDDGRGGEVTITEHTTFIAFSTNSGRSEYAGHKEFRTAGGDPINSTGAGVYVHAATGRTLHQN